MATGGCTYPSTKERSNYVRLCRAIADLGTNVLRDTLSNKLVVPSHLHRIVRNCDDLKTKPLNAEERKKINNAVTNSSFGEFDVSFLYKLIRAISVQDLRHKLNTNIPASGVWAMVQSDPSIKAQLSKEQEERIKFAASHGDYSECDCYLLTQLLSKLTSVTIPNIIPSANKWGGNSFPKSTDVNLGDDIERIRFLRNKVYGHVNGTCVTDAEFQSHWAALSGIMHRMDQHLNTGGRYLTDLNDIESASLDENWGYYESEIERLAKYEQEIDSKVEKQEKSFENLQTNVADIEDQVGELQLSNREMQIQVTSHTKDIANISQDKDNPVPLNIREQNAMVADLWTEEDIVFIETRATKQALDLIHKNNILSVIGNAGTGKSTIIHHIALQLKSKGYDILEIHSPSEITSYLNPDSKQVFVIDDPVGVHGLDYERLSTWNRYDTRLRLCLSKGDHKLLCSVRKQVANEPDFVKEKTIFNETYIYLQDEACFLTDEEKMKMLQQHLKKNKYGDHYQILTKIKTVLKDTLEHFPLICKLFSSKKEFQKYGLGFFKQPFSFILEDLNAMKRGDNRKYCTLVMCFINKNYLDLNDFDVFNSKGIDEKLKSVMQACGVNKNEFCGTLGDNVISLSGVYFKQEGKIFKFNHDLIHDVVAFNFGQQYPKQMIEFSPNRFLCERVSLDDNVVSQDPYVLILDSGYYDLLLKRLLSDLEGGEGNNFVTKNKCWDNKIFMNVFCKEFKNHKDKICHLFCKKIKQNKEYVDKVKSEMKDLRKSDFSQLCSRQTYVLTLRLVHDITLLHLMIMYAHTDFFKLIWDNLSLDDRKNINSKIPLLHYACLGGDIDICDIILRDTQCSVNSVFRCEQTILSKPIDFSALHLASFNNTVIIKYLLSRGSNINAVLQNRFKSGTTAIAVASGSGNIDNVSLLMKEGADINNEGCPLVFAAANNHVKIVQLLLPHIANIDIKSSDGWTALKAASRYGYNEIVQLLLSYKASVDMHDNDGWTALMAASRYGHNEIVQLLLSHKARVDMQDNKGVTALMAASRYGHNEIVKLLLSHNASVDMQDNEGVTALMFTSGNGHNEIVPLLLSHKASVDIQDNDGWTALMVASRYGNSEIVQLLLSHKTNVDMYNDEGRTALMMASRYGYNEIVQLLLIHEANVDIQNDKGVTALMFASGNGHNEIVQQLLSHKANVDIQDSKGWTALMHASCKGHNGIVQLLFSHKASVEMQNDKGVTALMFASCNGHTVIVQQLLSHKASCDMQMKEGWTALMMASRNDYNDIVQLLLSHKASVDMQDNEGKTALMMASRNGYNEIVQLLLSHKASVDMRDNKGWTALMKASRHCHNEIVQLLLSHKANVDIQDNEGVTALMFASRNGHYEIVQLLLCHKANVDMQNNKG